MATCLEQVSAPNGKSARSLNIRGTEPFVKIKSPRLSSRFTSAFPRCRYKKEKFQKMPKRRATELEKSKYAVELIKSLHQAMKLINFTSENVYEFCIANGVPEDETGRLLGALLRSYKSKLFIRLTRQFRTSKRTGRVLPLWTVKRSMKDV